MKKKEETTSPWIIILPIIVVIIGCAFIPIKKNHLTKAGDIDAAEWKYYSAEITKEVIYYNKTSEFAEFRLLVLSHADENNEDGIDSIELRIKDDSIYHYEDVFDKVTLSDGGGITYINRGLITCYLFGLICDDDNVELESELVVGSDTIMLVYDSICTDDDRRKASTISTSNEMMPYFSDYFDESIATCKKESDNYILVNAGDYFRDLLR